MSSLAEQLSKLVTPAPVFEDPEDITDDTAAKVVPTADGVDDDDIYEGQTPSKLRSRAAVLLSQEDSKYAGRETSRRNRQDSLTLAAIAGASTDEDADSDLVDEQSGVDTDVMDDQSDVSSGVDSDDDDDDDGDSDDLIHSDGEEEQLEGFKEKLKFQDSSPRKEKFTFDAGGDFAQYADAEEDDDEGSDDDDDDEEDSDSDEETGSDEDSEDEDGEDDEDMDDEGGSGGVQQFTKVNVEDEIQKGKAVRAQLGIWDSLLEGRIKLQKVLVISNQLPQPDQWDAVLEAGGSEYEKALQESHSFLHKLLEQLVNLQTMLLQQNPETKSLADSDQPSKHKKPSKPEIHDDSNEEITSESEAESEEESDQSQPSKQSLKRKLKASEYPEFIAKRHADFEAYRNTTIQKWYDKTRVSSGRLGKGFNAFEQSALKQINQILSDRDRLIKRTQLRRSAYQVLCKPEKAVEETKADDDFDIEKEALPSRSHLKDYDEEIFDDDDFYHQQLRQLIERKTSDISDPLTISRQWLEIQKLRNKTKKVVDTKASKGRKIRYNIHSKLVNFMAPVEHSQWTDEARDELYRSLFGKNAAKSSSTDTDQAR